MPRFPWLEFAHIRLNQENFCYFQVTKYRAQKFEGSKASFTEFEAKLQLGWKESILGAATDLRPQM